MKFFYKKCADQDVFFVGLLIFFLCVEISQANYLLGAVRAGGIVALIVAFLFVVRRLRGVEGKACAVLEDDGVWFFGFFWGRKFLSYRSISGARVVSTILGDYLMVDGGRRYLNLNFLELGDRYRFVSGLAANCSDMKMPSQFGSETN